MSKPTPIDPTKTQLPGRHLVTSTHKVDVYYPDHEDRKESALFARTKKKMIKVDKTPCWICGTYEDLEAHHFHVEWAMTDGVDWDLMRQLHPNFNWSKFKTPVDFVDSEYNMMVLCAFHHRDEAHGIHSLPYPIWVMQKYKLPNYILLLEDNK